MFLTFLGLIQSLQGDLVAQGISEEGHKYDPMRTVRFTFLGGAFAPILHFWFVVAVVGLF